MSKLTVLDARWLSCFSTEALLLVFLVVLEVTFNEDYFTVAFKGHNVSANTV